ncbi:MAG: bifunctional proline dehydrogenase/L-glutamate gamma-semialdehyde dehydrogenase PutA [Alphaproteobacteria bacterium]|nr:bifunctional proline dehydrogenase/L-glutamate gamma-semialdehyde dehydrogenase PutA [Alphaproteobacteria bacterium]
MLDISATTDTSPARQRLATALAASETDIIEALLPRAAADPATKSRIDRRAQALVATVRAKGNKSVGIEAFLQEFSLSSREGVVLMCLAEALLRIPDADTADKLIRDKLSDADWAAHLGHSESLFVNASTWALMLTGKIMRFDERRDQGLGGTLKRLISASGEPVIRAAVGTAMKILGRQFVMGRTIEEALTRAAPDEPKGWRHSYDMLGEAARTAADAERYFRSYADAIAAIGRASNGRGPVDGPGISVKLSALHPRFEVAQGARVRRELGARLVEIARLARSAGIGMTVDAEEAERLELSLDLIDAAMGDVSLKDWDGFGLAVQAYQKRALPLVEWLAERARAGNRRLMVRLVKGAYWDSEVKRAQERGLAGYPVFTRKASTDVSYLACARAMLAAPEHIYPQFATHNAHTLAAILEFAGNRPYEFQRLHGMGEQLYAEVVTPDRPCRVYAPVGSHEDLLPYLVRRLLENGANTSFVNRLADEEAPIEHVVADPVATVAQLDSKPHPRIVLPADLYRPERANSAGIDLNDWGALRGLEAELARAAARSWRAAPTGGRGQGTRAIHDPADRRRVVGEVTEAGEGDVDRALTAAGYGWGEWDRRGGADRATILERAAELYEARRAELLALIVREGGRTIPDALSELREAVDFLRYYAARARAQFGEPGPLPGPTGGRNTLVLAGRGIFACISPWNFPVAIFTGQVAAALAAGNAVMAKPAEQTPLTAARCVGLLHEAGVPEEVLALLPGDGRVGAALTRDPRVAGVCFTGSTEVARLINQSLANRAGPIAPLIAETGGLNAMIVDSSALPEQVVADTLLSAFNSAGQRCSALRLLCVQDDVADKVLHMLEGAMAELVVGDPGRLATDIGPVIDAEAQGALEIYAREIAARARRVAECRLPADAAAGSFVAPVAYEIGSPKELTREIFGPILHVVRWRADTLAGLVDAIGASGYGLTLGIHSRVDSTVEAIIERARVGNIYVNRNMIGAVVGTQPFGGEGLSGTGPKAGGPHYLQRFAVERCVAIDVTAQGGNASLLMLDEGPK